MQEPPLLLFIVIIFFGLLLILSGILLAVFAIKRPDLVFYELNEKGLKIKNRLFPYENIQSFWIKTKEDKEIILFIKTERFFMPIISIPIKQEIEEEIKKMMYFNEIPEEEMREHVSEKIMNSLGF